MDYLLTTVKKKTLNIKKDRQVLINIKGYYRVFYINLFYDIDIIYINLAYDKYTSIKLKSYKIFKVFLIILNKSPPHSLNVIKAYEKEC